MFRPSLAFAAFALTLAASAGAQPAKKSPYADCIAKFDAGIDAEGNHSNNLDDGAAFEALTGLSWDGQSWLEASTGATAEPADMERAKKAWCSAPARQRKPMDAEKVKLAKELVEWLPKTPLTSERIGQFESLQEENIGEDLHLKLGEAFDEALKADVQERISKGRPLPEEQARLVKVRLDWTDAQVETANAEAESVGAAAKIDEAKETERIRAKVKAGALDDKPKPAKKVIPAAKSGLDPKLCQENYDEHQCDLVLRRHDDSSCLRWKRCIEGK